MYDIKIEYITGNSFGSEETENMLDLPTASLDVAKENLKRIKEHYKIYKLKNNYSSKYKDIKYPDFYIQESYEDKGIWGIQDGIKLLTDKGERNYYPFWIGYFELLLGAEIISVLNENDLSFRV
jgi:hypothetical protein